jgi:hypothetical protein
MQRRDLLRVVSASGALHALGALSPEQLAALAARVHTAAHTQARLRTLTPAQATVVTAAAARIIPRTDTPGATEANVTAFIDVMLTDWYPPAEAQRFTAGLAALDAAAQRAHQRDFVACSAAQQEVIVTAFDAADATRRRTDAAGANADWYGLLKYLTVYGYCTSEVGMRQHLRSWPPPMRYDGHARVTP